MPAVVCIFNSLQAVWMQCNQVVCIRHGKTSDKPTPLCVILLTRAHFSIEMCPTNGCLLSSSWPFERVSRQWKLVYTVSLRFAILLSVCTTQRLNSRWQTLRFNSIQLNSVDTNDPHIVIDKHSVTTATQWIWQSMLIKSHQLFIFISLSLVFCFMFCSSFPQLETKGVL